MFSTALFKASSLKIYLSVSTMLNMIDGTGELNAQFFSRDEKYPKAKTFVNH